MQGSGSEPPGQHTNQGPDREQRFSKKQPLKSLDKNVYHEFWFLSPTIIDLSTRFLFTTLICRHIQPSIDHHFNGQYTNQESDWIHLFLVANSDFTGSSYPTINNFHFIRKILQKKFVKIVSMLLFFWIYKNYNPYWDFKGENACAGRHDHQKYACAGQHDRQKYTSKSQYGFDKKNCCS